MQKFFEIGISLGFPSAFPPRVPFVNSPVAYSGNPLGVSFEMSPGTASGNTPGDSPGYFLQKILLKILQKFLLGAFLMFIMLIFQELFVEIL